MAILTSCPRCGVETRLPSSQRGLKQRCKKCKTTYVAADDGGLDTGGSPMLKLCLFAGGFLVLVGGIWAYAIFSSSPNQSKVREDSRAELRDEDPLPRPAGTTAAATPAPTGANSSANGGLPQQNQDNSPPRDLNHALSLLGNLDAVPRVRASLKWLSTCKVDEKRRAEVSQVLDTMHAHPGYRKDSMPAVAHWSTVANASTLISWLDDGDANIRKIALASLAKFNDEPSVEAVAKLLQKPGREAEASRALKGSPPRVAEKFVVKHLHSQRPALAREAEALLKTYRTPKGLLIEQSIEDLTSGDVNVRKSACDWLARTEPEAEHRDRVARTLEGMAKDRDNAVKLASVKALAVWATRDSLTALTEALKDTATRDIAMQGLLKAKFDEVIPVLAANLGSREGEQIARVLIEFGPKSERFVWVPLERGDVFTRRRAAEILGDIGTADSVKILTRFAALEKSGRNLANQEAAQAAIKKIRDRQTPPKTP